MEDVFQIKRKRMRRQEEIEDVKKKIHVRARKMFSHRIGSASRSGNVSLEIFITSVSGSESLASFTNRTFHLSRPPSFRMAFDAAERNGRFGRIQCQRCKESSSRRKRKRRVFLCRWTVKVKVGDKVIPASSLKIEGRRTFVGAKDRGERDRQENW